MTNDYEVIDNFLEPEVFKNLQSAVMSWETHWKFSDYVSSASDNLDQFYFIHPIFENFLVRSPLFEIFARAFVPPLQIYSLARMKVNLYPRNDTIIKHGWHTDSKVHHKGAIFYINTCNGYTGIKDEKIFSVENRILKFDSRLEHHSTTCTDAKARLTLNINYF